MPDLHRKFCNYLIGYKRPFHLLIMVDSLPFAKDFETLKRSLGCKELPGTVIFSAAKDGLQSKEDPFAQKLNIPMILIKWEGRGPF